jgi:hypothetical protein
MGRFVINWRSAGDLKLWYKLGLLIESSLNFVSNETIHPQINVCFYGTSSSYWLHHVVYRWRACGDTLVDFHLSSKRNLWYGYERHDGYQWK